MYNTTLYNSKHFIVIADSCSDDGKRYNIIQLEYDNNIVIL